MEFKDVEKLRKAYYEKLRSGYITSFVVAIIIAFIALIFSGSGSGASFIIVFLFSLIFFGGIGAAITNALSNKQAVAYHKAYKAHFVEQSLKNTFTELQYDHYQGLARNIISSTNMINTGDVYDSNDYTSGKYKNVSFVQADAHIQSESTDSDGNTHYYTIFKGRFMIFEFPKKFNFKLELIGHRFHPYRIPGKDSITKRKMSKISTESNEFNHAFKIYGEDGFEAFYLLDPKIMSRLMDIAEHYKYKVLFGFIDNRLFIALDDGKDSFEPPKPSKPLDEQAELAKVTGDIKVITDFVDLLSLDHKLFI